MTPVPANDLLSGTASPLFDEYVATPAAVRPAPPSMAANALLVEEGACVPMASFHDLGGGAFIFDGLKLCLLLQSDPSSFARASVLESVWLLLILVAMIYDFDWRLEAAVLCVEV